MKRLTVISLIVLVLVGACRRDRYRVDISGIKVDVKIKRLEQDLFAHDPVRIPDTVEVLKKKYGEFLKYFSYVINIGEPDDSLWLDGLLKFCTDRLNNEVYEATLKVFPDLEWLEKDFSKSFRYYKYYFPDKSVPEVFSCITGFNTSIITGDSVLGIGLDRFLGSDCRYYPQLGIYTYLADRMTPEYILTGSMYAWASSEWDYNIIGYIPDNVLASIIHEGKLLYFVKCMVPWENDEIIFGFSQKQMEFCLQNEGDMWQYLIENDLLFSTDSFTKRKLVGEAPFTSYFSRESPGRAAAWIGFRIVEAFMKYNKDMTLEKLMNISDPQVILSGSRYSPSTS